MMMEEKIWEAMRRKEKGRKGSGQRGGSWTYVVLLAGWLAG